MTESIADLLIGRWKNHELLGDPERRGEVLKLIQYHSNAGFINCMTSNGDSILYFEPIRLTGNKTGYYPI